ncbi:MAG: MTH938/NDUFAF3 family protein [Actinomycetota bacterium]|nr:MTH938/NDUFAF3 family protein [Actinomycetota bacterium]
MRIDDYEYGRVVIDGREERNDVILVDGTLHANWWRDEGHRLQVEDLQPVLDAEPDLLVVGTGTAGNMRPASDLDGQLRSHGIELEAMPSPQAVRRYNEVARAGDRDVALAIHLTC